MNLDSLMALKNADTTPCVKIFENQPHFSLIPLRHMAFGSDTATRVKLCQDSGVWGCLPCSKNIFYLFSCAVIS